MKFNLFKRFYNTPNIDKAIQANNKKKELSQQEEFKILQQKISIRIKESYTKLNRYGIKGLDYYNTLSIKQKILIGTTLAGAGFVLGGEVAIIIKLLSLSSTSRGRYLYRLDKYKKDTLSKCGTVADVSDDEIVMDSKIKKQALLKSILEGILLSIVTTAALENITGIGKDLLSAEKTVDEIINSIRDDNKEIKAVNQIVEPVSLDKYIVIKGDCLEKVLSRNLFLESDKVDDFKKLNIVSNFIKSDEGRKILSDMGIIDVNKLSIGQQIDLDLIRQFLYNKIIKK